MLLLFYLILHLFCRVATYKQKISGFDQVSVDLFHQLSAWEKQLIETQDVVEIRGKVSMIINNLHLLFLAHEINISLKSLSKQL